MGNANQNLAQSYIDRCNSVLSSGNEDDATELCEDIRASYNEDINIFGAMDYAYVMNNKLDYLKEVSKFRVALQKYLADLS